MNIDLIGSIELTPWPNPHAWQATRLPYSFWLHSITPMGHPRASRSGWNGINRSFISSPSARPTAKRCWQMTSPLPHSRAQSPAWRNGMWSPPSWCWLRPSPDCTKRARGGGWKCLGSDQVIDTSGSEGDVAMAGADSISAPVRWIGGTEMAIHAWKPGPGRSGARMERLALSHRLRMA